MVVFDTCKKINDHLSDGNDEEARNELISLLDYHKKSKLPYSPLVNHLIRETGLYPYLQVETADWQDRFVYEAFKANNGAKNITLHREQSSILKRLLNDESIAVSAPTSFGKSFIIDTYIALKKPKNVVIIVPTIALTDETRRRLFKKFSATYKIITTSEVVLADYNIFIFPQERAMSYVDKIEEIDILIIDEFYKASLTYDERAPTLLKAIIKLGTKAKQKYFLAPNISSITDNVFLKNVEFVPKLNFNTVYLEKFNLFAAIGRDEIKKGQALLKIINETQTKSLIYAASYPQIEKVSNLLLESLKVLERKTLINFSNWLTLNYDANWKLTNLIKRGIGIHNGQLHRSLSQIQVKLFEDELGIDNLISTSSIIEGVNTSAENVIIWRNKKSGSNTNLDTFTYKNIIGRGGRMFKYFIGKIYLLESPPGEGETQLDIPFPDEILGDLDEQEHKESLSTEQLDKISLYKNEMNNILGEERYTDLKKENVFQLASSDLIKRIASDLKANSKEWNGLAYLNSDDVERWEWLLLKITYFQPGEWGEGKYKEQHEKFVAFVKILSENWVKTIPELLDELDAFDIDIEDFFKLERAASYKLAALLNDINILQKEILKINVDISPFIAKVSHAFLPSVVYQLEEYGLPRMLSRKLHDNNIINFLDQDLTIHTAISIFHEIGREQLLSRQLFDDFDKYILEYFYDGITTSNP